MPKYKKCLCVKYGIKWKEVFYYTQKNRLVQEGIVQFIDSYDEKGNYRKLITIKFSEDFPAKFKMKRIEVSK